MSSTSRRCKEAIFCHKSEFARIVAAALLVKLPRYSGFGVVTPGLGVGVNFCPRRLNDGNGECEQKAEVDRAATGEPGVTIVLPAVRHLAASVQQSCVKCDRKAVFWLSFVEAGILQGPSA